MKLYLPDTLATQRRGRFLTSLLNAETINLASLPEQGCLLMLGEDFSHYQKKAELLHWAIKPGCVLLLLPPYALGSVCAELDWQVQLWTDHVPMVSEHPLVVKVASEVNEQLLGQDGHASREAGHCWLSGEAHTRYWKKHSNSGVVAMTTLPLWSITLLDDAVVVHAWVSWFLSHAGSFTIDKLEVDSKALVLTGEDYCLLVCAFGYDTGSLSEIKTRNFNQPVPLFDLAKINVNKCWEKFQAYELLSDTGLTEKGLQRLKQSPYWLYAQELKRIEQ